MTFAAIELGLAFARGERKVLAAPTGDATLEIEYLLEALTEEYSGRSRSRRAGFAIDDDVLLLELLERVSRRQHLGGIHAASTADVSCTEGLGIAQIDDQSPLVLKTNQVLR